MPIPESFSAFRELCGQNERFLVISHARPDGDAYGSTLGLGLALRALGKDVIVANTDGMAASFAFLPGSGTIVPAPASPEHAG